MRKNYQEFSNGQVVLFTEDSNDYWTVVGVGKFLRDCDTNQIEEEFKDQLGTWKNLHSEKTEINWDMRDIFPILVKAGWVEDLNPTEWNII